MSKVLYEVRNGTHVQWSLDKYDLEKLSHEPRMFGSTTRC